MKIFARKDSLMVAPTHKLTVRQFHGKLDSLGEEIDLVSKKHGEPKDANEEEYEWDIDFEDIRPSVVFVEWEITEDTITRKHVTCIVRPTKEECGLNS